MTCLHRRQILSLVIFPVVLAVVAMAACTSRSIIGDQQGTGGIAGTQGPSTGGTGGTWGSAGTSGAVSSGDAGSPGAAGTFLAGAAGAAGTSGDVGSAGTSGAAGTAGTAGAGVAICPSAWGGSAGTGIPFGAPIEYATNRYASFVEIGELNGDGKPDIVAANYYFADQTGIAAAAGRPGGDGGSLSVFVSESGGGFAQTKLYQLRDPPSSLAVGDLDGDGKADVALVNQLGVSVFINDGSGGLLPPEAYITGVDAQWVAIGDVNGDGRRDLAVANRGYGASGETDGDVGLLLNVGQNPRFAALNYPAGRHPVHVAIGDLNGDGKADLAVANSTGIAVLTNTGGNAFSAPATFAAGTGAASTTIGDVNGDAKPDLVLARGGFGAGVLLNVGSGLFAAATTYEVPTSFNIALGDVTGDGKPDLIGTLGVPSSQCGAITFAPNTGSGRFGASLTIPVDLTTGPVTAVDFNGDGKVDIAVPNVAGVGVLLNAPQ